MRQKRESKISFNSTIFRGPRLYKDWLAEVLQFFKFALDYQISFSQRGNSDSSIEHAELRTGSIDYCRLSEAYGFSRLELRRCLDRSVSLSASVGLRKDFPMAVSHSRG